MAKKDVIGVPGVVDVATPTAPAYAAPVGVLEDSRDQEIADLKAKLAAITEAQTGGPVQEYPKAKYQKVPIEIDPRGYRPVRVNDPAEEQRLGPDWKDSPAEL